MLHTVYTTVEKKFHKGFFTNVVNAEKKWDKLGRTWTKKCLSISIKILKKVRDREKEHSRKKSDTMPSFSSCLDGRKVCYRKKCDGMPSCSSIKYHRGRRNVNERNVMTCLAEVAL